MRPSFTPRAWDGSAGHERTLLVVEPDPSGGHRARIVDVRLPAPPEASAAPRKQS